MDDNISYKPSHSKLTHLPLCEKKDYKGKVNPSTPSKYYNSLTGAANFISYRDLWKE